MPFFVVMSELFINLVINLMYSVAVQCSVCTASYPVVMREKWTQRPMWDADLKSVNCDHLCSLLRNICLYSMYEIRRFFQAQNWEYIRFYWCTIFELNSWLEVMLHASSFTCCISVSYIMRQCKWVPISTGITNLSLFVVNVLSPLFYVVLKVCCRQYIEQRHQNFNIVLLSVSKFMKNFNLSSTLMPHM
jgi:hypothetical protein